MENTTKILKSLNIRLEIVRTRRGKSVLIEVHPESVRIRAPHFLPITEIHEILRRREDWIKEKVHLQSQRKLIFEKKYQDEEIFSYLGRSYRLQLIASKVLQPSVSLQGKFIVVAYPQNATNVAKKMMVKKSLESWYCQRGKIFIEKRTHYFAKKINVIPKSIKVRAYKSRWGSCSSTGDICFNWRIMIASPMIINYVIIHELCHILEHNHSSRFWQYVAQYMPDYREHRTWLKKNGITLSV